MSTAFDMNLGEGPAGGFLIMYGFIFIFCSWQFTRRYSNSKALEDRYSLVADFTTCLTSGLQILLLGVTEFSENAHAIFALTAFRSLLQYCLYAEICCRWAKLYDGLLPENNHLERNLRYLFVAGGTISLVAFVGGIAVSLMFASDHDGFGIAVALGALPVAIVSIVVGVIYIPVAKMLIRGVQEHNQPPDDSEVVAGAQRSSTHRVFYVVAAFTILYIGGCVVLLIGGVSPDHYVANFVDIKSAYLTIDGFSLIMIVYLNNRLALRNTIDPPERHCDMLGREIKPIVQNTKPAHERKLTQRLFGRSHTSPIGDRPPPTALHSPSSSRFSLSNFSESRAPTNVPRAQTSPIPNHSALSTTTLSMSDRKSSSSMLSVATHGFSLADFEASLSLTFPSNMPPFVSAKYRAAKAAAIANGLLEREHKDGDIELSNSSSASQNGVSDLQSSSDSNVQQESSGSSENISHQLLPNSNCLEKSNSVSVASTSESDVACVSIQIETPEQQIKKSRRPQSSPQGTSSSLFSSSFSSSKNSEHSKRRRRFASRHTRSSLSFSGSIPSARKNSGSKLRRSSSQRALVDTRKGSSNPSPSLRNIETSDHAGATVV